MVYKTEKSMLGKWDKWNKKIEAEGPFRYGDTITYKLAADFLRDIREVEDWGCGACGFKRFYKGKYIGIDGSANPFVDRVADLREYRSNVDGIVMRHVLDHNYDWKEILSRAVTSFRKKFCLILFTPFVDETKEIAHNKKYGVDAPDIAFNKKDIEYFFKGLNWKLEENIKTKTGYGVEHIYYVEKPKDKVCVISANLGGFEKQTNHIPQTIPYDYYLFQDEHLPPREKTMTPRLQAKIPKFFGWQLAPGYKYYLWVDGNIYLSNHDSLKYFYDNCQGYDIVALKHPNKPNIRQETRYTRKGVSQRAKSFYERYKNEAYQELYNIIRKDKEFEDDFLVIGGVFMYKNTPKVQEMLKEWWYYVTRYCVQDQISFPYVLKKFKMEVNIRPDNFKNCPYINVTRHRRRS